MWLIDTALTCITDTRLRRPSDLVLGSLSCADPRCSAFILHNLFKTAARLQVCLLLLGGALQLFPAHMSLMKL